MQFSVISFHNKKNNFIVPQKKKKKPQKTMTILQQDI